MLLFDIDLSLEEALLFGTVRPNRHEQTGDEGRMDGQKMRDAGVTLMTCFSPKSSASGRLCNMSLSAGLLL